MLALFMSPFADNNEYFGRGKKPNKNNFCVLGGGAGVLITQHDAKATFSSHRRVKQNARRGSIPLDHLEAELGLRRKTFPTYGNLAITFEEEKKIIGKPPQSLTLTDKLSGEHPVPHFATD